MSHGRLTDRLTLVYNTCCLSLPLISPLSPSFPLPDLPIVKETKLPVLKNLNDTGKLLWGCCKFTRIWSVVGVTKSHNASIGRETDLKLVACSLLQILVRMECLALSVTRQERSYSFRL